MGASLARWAQLAAGAVVFVTGGALAIVSVSGLGLIDRTVAGDVDIAELRAYDSLWKTIIFVMTAGLVVEGLLRDRWVTDWLGLQGVPREDRRSETASRLESRPPVDRRLFRIGSLLTILGLAGIAGAIAVSVLLPDGETPLRLSFLGKAIGGAGVAAASASFAALVLRNRTYEPIEVTRRRPPAGV